MTDFAEISHDLLQAGGALQVTAKDLATIVADLLADDGKRQRMGRLAGELVLSHQGATPRTLALIREIIGHG
jgi:3-deoxy-D-manno-octulosonic-acid transferase